MAANHSGLQWNTIRNPSDGVGADASGVNRPIRPAVLALQDADALAGSPCLNRARRADASHLFITPAGGDAVKLPPDRNGPEAASARRQRQPVMSSTTPWPVTLCCTLT